MGETRFYPGTFRHNDTTFIGAVMHMAHGLYPMVQYNNARNTMVSYGGMIQYTFNTDMKVNEIIYAPRYCEVCTNNPAPTKILIEYSNDGENWSTDHEYVKGVDYENGLVAHALNVSDVMFLQRDLSTGHWKPGVIKRKMRGRNPHYPDYIVCNDVTCSDNIPPDTPPIIPSPTPIVPAPSWPTPIVPAPSSPTPIVPAPSPNPSSTFYLILFFALTILLIVNMVFKKDY